eukprot:jgi/Botrbrau1/12936/Bobra.92_1s0016.1
MVSYSRDSPSSSLSTTGTAPLSGTSAWKKGPPSLSESESFGSPWQTVKSKGQKTGASSKIRACTPGTPGQPRLGPGPVRPTSDLATAADEIKRQLDPRRIREAMNKIKNKAGANRAYDAGEHEDNQDKNRYAEVLPFDFNRVILHQEDKDWGYINASEVSAKLEDEPNWHYIVTQGPLITTMNDFWRMVYETKSRIIIMLTQFEEVTADGKRIEKSTKYLPSTVDPMRFTTFGEVTVTMEKEEPVPDYPCILKRDLVVNNLENDDERKITHYQFTHWPDKSVPRSPKEVLYLVRMLEYDRSAYKDPCVRKTDYGPPIIHCNSGVGRSGAFCAIDIVLGRLRYLRTTGGNGNKDVKELVALKDLVLFLRKERISMVENEQQYKFCLDAIRDGIQGGLCA